MTREEQNKEFLKEYETLTPEEQSKVRAKIAEIRAERQRKEVQEMYKALTPENKLLFLAKYAELLAEQEAGT